MIPTVEQILADAAYLAGDPRAVRFNAGITFPAFKHAWEEMFEEFKKAGIPRALGDVQHVVNAGTASLDPVADMSLATFANPVWIGERPESASADTEFSEVNIVRRLTDGVGAEKILDVEWRGAVFYFRAPTANVRLRIRFETSGPTMQTGSTGVEGSLLFLSRRTAAIAGEPMGMDPAKVAALPQQALKSLQDNLLPAVRQMNSDPLQFHAYDEDSSVLYYDTARPPIFR